MNLVGIAEAADRIGTPVGTLRYWIRLGIAPPSVKMGRRRVFREEDIDAWIDSKFADQGQSESEPRAAVQRDEAATVRNAEGQA